MLQERETREICAVFEKALKDNRRGLYEFEVYQILEIIGLQVPVFRFITDSETVDDAFLSAFGEKLVCKIVSNDVAHKQKLGGVEIIRNGNPLFVQFVLEKMKERILRAFPKGGKPVIAGYLVVEFIPFKPALGYEVLIGFKQDPAFGPILTLSKGGEDAEFFAEYYDAPNLFAPPLNAEEAKTAVNSLKIKHRFEEIGRPEYLDYIADALAKMSDLAYTYSAIVRERRECTITAFDVNPFVISETGRYVAVDGFAQFDKTKESGVTLPLVNLRNLDPFFNPRGIAVIGVSSDVKKGNLGVEIAKLLHELGRKDIYFVNIKGGEIRFGDTHYSLYRDISEVPGPVELIVYTAPAPYSIDFFKNLRQEKYKSVILISGIPAALNYTEYVRELRKVVSKDLRVIGPNCVGIISAPAGEDRGVNTFFIDKKRLKVDHSPFSNTVLLTQSGGFAISEIDRLQNSKLFHSLISFGNKYDVKITDLMAYFENKDAIKVIALYVEGFDPGEGRQFFELARKMSKPIIIYKSGRTETGARAAATHTASMSGDYDVFTAVCEQAGVIFTHEIEDHYNYIKAFSLLTGRKPGGRRTGGVVNSGFEATVAGDELGGLLQAPLSEKTAARLAELNIGGLIDVSSTFLDVTPMADDAVYADYIEVLLRDETIDSLFVSVIPHAPALKTDPEHARDPDSLGNRLVRLFRKYEKPMVISVNAGSYYADFVGVMEENGLPVYTDIISAVHALNEYVSYFVA
jgi:3-hydroxypropionyl-CoA synthetase (ADP-forming)